MTRRRKPALHPRIVQLGPETFSKDESAKSIRLDGKRAVTIVRSTFVRASAERSFLIISKQFEETPGWDPTVMWVEPICVKHVGVGSMSRVTFTFEGTTEEAIAMIRSVKPNRAIMWTSTHSSGLREEWQLQPATLGTVITVTLSYNPGGWFLGRFTDRIVMRKKVERTVEEMMKRLGEVVENSQEV